MTTAGGGGSSGVEYGSDYVTARLGVDIDSGSVQSVQELTKEIERFHTAMEATVRGEADMTRYLDQMAESAKSAAAAQTNLTQQLQVFMQMQGRMGGGSSGGMGYPGVGGGAAVNPFATGMPGMGMPPGAIRPPNPTDVVWQLNSVAGRSPAEAAQFMNMQHPRGNLTGADTVNISPGSIQSLADQIASREKAVQATHRAAAAHQGNQPPRQGASGDVAAQLQQRIAGTTGLAGQVMNEIGGGAGLSGVVGLASRGLNWAGSKLGGYAAKREAAQGGEEGDEENPTDSDDKTSGLTKAAKGIPIVGGVLAGVAGVFDLVGKAGQMEQGWRNIASQRGGSAGEGFEASMRARSTAMDPNISTGQARSMYQAAISEGYATASGGGADDIIALFRTELKQLNQTTQQVVTELRLGRIGHDQQVGAAAIMAADQALKKQAQSGYVPLPDLVASRNSEWQTQIAQGVGPAQAFQNAQVGTSMYSDDSALAGKYGTQTFNRPSLGMMEAIYGGPGGTASPPPAGLMMGSYQAWLDRMGKGDEHKAEVTRKIAVWARDLRGDKSGGNDRTNPLYFQAVQDFIKRYSTNVDNTLDPDAMEALYMRYAWGKTLDGAATSSDPHTVVAQAKQDTIKNARAADGGRDYNVAKRGGGDVPTSYGAPAIDRILKAYGSDPTQIQVSDGSGGWTGFDPRNEKQQQQLAAGDLNWRHKGDKGAGLSVEETPTAIGSRFSTDNPQGTMGGSRPNPNQPGQQVSGNLTVTIDQSGHATAPKSVPLTPTQQGANQGQRGVQVNQTPPGDRGFDRGMWGTP